MESRKAPLVRTPKMYDPTTKKQAYRLIGQHLWVATENGLMLRTVTGINLRSKGRYQLVLGAPVDGYDLLGVNALGDKQATLMRSASGQETANGPFVRIKVAAEYFFV